MEDNQNRNAELFKKILKYFGFIMVLIYVALGFFIIFSKLFTDALPQWQRVAVGVVLIVYGLFRAYRTLVNEK